MRLSAMMDLVLEEVQENLVGAIALDVIAAMHPGFRRQIRFR
jgi:hypothetical protein